MNAAGSFFIKTLGCKVNQYEAQAMRELLCGLGLEELSSGSAADVLIVNTCTVTAEADRESRHLIASFHKANPDARIVVTGCYAERASDDVKSLPGVACVVKNAEKNRISAALGLEPAGKTQPLQVTGFKDRSKAFVKIQDGCNNFCSYCAVPYVRSAMWSRPLQEIREEVEALVANGFREIVLTGICLGAHSAGLASVLRSLGGIRGDFRIRLSSLECAYVTDELIECMAGSKRFCRHLHIPLQSGDDTILKRMNRPYTAAAYKAMVDVVRKKIPGVAVTTDCMVGFPGESDANFGNTLGLSREIAFSRMHIFTYSKREGTAAAEMGDACDDAAARMRYGRLETVARESEFAFRRRFEGAALDVLVETKRDRRSGRLKGYSDNYIKVVFDGPDSLMKKVVPVKIVSVEEDEAVGIYG